MEMEQLLEKVPGKLFRYCDLKTRKIIRLVCHSFALDIDVFTGLSVIIDSRFESSLDFVRSVRVCKLNIRNISRMKINATDNFSLGLLHPSEFPFVERLSLNGFVEPTWCLDCLTKFDNLTSLFIGGSALNYRIFNARIRLEFPVLETLEISSSQAKSNILNVSEEGRDGEEEEEDKATEIEFASRRFRRIGPLDLENGKCESTPVADNIYHLLSSVSSPKLNYFRLSYDDDLYNMGPLNWKDGPLTDFLRRHARTLRHLTLDGEQNDQPSISRPKRELQPLPSNLHHIFVSIVDHSEYSDHKVALPLIRNVMRLRRDPARGSLWKRLLKKQTQLESLHCTIHAPWAWADLSRTITKSCEFLQVINIGCSWLDFQSPVNVDIIGECLFLKKFTLSVTTSAASTILEEEERNRCRIKNLSSLLTCIFLESIFISSALCETDDLEVFTQLPNLTSLVLMYVGKMTRYGVNVGILQDLLSLRELNLLVVVEFHRQKHSLDSYRLKRILRSAINNQNCPIIHHIVPYSCFGKFVYVGDITELTLGGQVNSLQ